MELDEIFNKILDIKEMERTGWVEKGIPKPESVADHTLGVIALASLIDLPKNINREKLVNMAIFHDIGESLIGDRIWQRGATTYHDKRKQKEEDEATAINKILKSEKKFRDLVLEFGELKTPEAKFLKELDKLDMIFQALRYEQQGANNLQEFWDNVENYITFKETIEIFQKLKNLRKIN